MYFLHFDMNILLVSEIKKEVTHLVVCYTYSTCTFPVHVHIMYKDL